MEREQAVVYSLKEKILIGAGILFVMTPAGQMVLFKVAGWLMLSYFVLSDPWLGLSLLAFLAPFFSGFGAVSLFFTLKPVQVVTALLAARAVSDWRRGRLSLRPSYRMLYLLTVAAVGFAALTWSPDRGKALRMAVNFLWVLAIPWLCELYIRRMDQVKALTQRFFWGVLVLAAIHWVNRFTPLLPFEQGLTNNNHAAFLYTIGLFANLAVLLNGGRLPARVVHALGMAVLFGAWILTLSRSGYMAFGIALAVLFAFEFVFWKFSTRSERATLLLFLVVALLAAKALSMVWGEFYERIYSFKNLLGSDYLAVSLADPNGGIFGNRWAQLREMLPSVREHLLLGEGFTNRAISLHGLFFVLLASVGAVGLVAFLAFLADLIVSLWRSAHRSLDRGYERLSGIWITCLVSWMVVSLMESYLVHFHIWLIVGLALATVRLGAAARAGEAGPAARRGGAAKEEEPVASAAFSAEGGP